MRKEIINRIKWEESDRIQIFCNRQYKGYYVRGNIDSVWDSFSFYDEKSKECFASVNYLFLIIGLVNDQYQKRTKKWRRSTRSLPIDNGVAEWDTLGTFEWNTQKEYVDERKRRQLAIQREESNSHRHILEWREEVFRTESWVIDLDEAGITENRYLEESIRAKKDIILLDMDFLVDAIELKPNQRMRDHLNKIYTIPAFWFRPRNVRLQLEEPYHWFDDLYEILYEKFDCLYLEKKKYSRILESIGDLSYEWIQRKTISNRYLKRLNQLNKGIGDRTYPLTNFCYKFFDDLIDDLTTQKQMLKCQNCGDFFEHLRVRVKKFCSLKSEGKNCGKSARNKRYYRKRKK